MDPDATCVGRSAVMIKATTQIVLPIAPVYAHMYIPSRSLINKRTSLSATPFRIICLSECTTMIGIIMCTSNEVTVTQSGLHLEIVSRGG